MSAPILKLLGSDLLSSTGTVSTSDALKGKKAIGLYFSAHWCPPCRGFTPQLAKVYEGLVKAGKSLEIVFVSSDRSEEQFNEYFAEQPWLALPYAARDKKASLSKKFKVNGIPTLVILDGETGAAITTDGRSAVMEDPKGDNFPWKPPTVWEALGDEFLSNDGETVELEELKGKGKVIGLYFSAHWCPPCRGFTPELVKTYNKVKAAGKPLEIIFVSSDRDQKQFQEYFGEMPWLAIPQGDKRKGTLSQLFEVQGIPTLVFLDGDTGETINANGRAAVGSDPEGEAFPWHPKPVNGLHETADGINETPAVCVMMERCSAEIQAAFTAALTPIAEASQAEAKKGGDELLFFTATVAGEGPVDQIRKLTSLGEPQADKPRLLLLDVPDDGSFCVSPEDEAVTPESIAGFISKAMSRELERKNLGR